MGACEFFRFVRQVRVCMGELAASSKEFAMYPSVPLKIGKIHEDDRFFLVLKVSHRN